MTARRIADLVLWLLNYSKLQQQIPCGDDNKKSKGKNKNRSNSRSPAGMTTRKAKARTRTEATADPLRG
jgi:hypothetical protein